MELARKAGDLGSLGACLFLAHYHRWHQDGLNVWDHRTVHWNIRALKLDPDNRTAHQDLYDISAYFRPYRDEFTRLKQEFPADAEMLSKATFEDGPVKKVLLPGIHK